MQLSREADQARLYLGLMVASGVALAGVVVFGMILPNIHLSPGGPAPAATNAPKQALPEANYRVVYQKDATQVKADSAPFKVSGTTPGVCSKGGTKQACVATGEKVIADLKKMQADLKALTAPPRYVEGDKLLKQALQTEIDGLTLRDQALTSNDPTASIEPGNVKLAQAAQLFKKADQAFPADARPTPSLSF
jgi:hypothetical protein